MAVRTIRNGTITIKDGAAASTAATFDGELSWTVDYNRIAMRDRGVISHFRDGDQQGIPVTFSMKLQEFTNTTATILDAVRKVGGASGWTSVKSAGDGNFYFDIEVTMSDPGGGASETLTFNDCILQEWSFSEAEDGDMLSFTCLSLDTDPVLS